MDEDFFSLEINEFLKQNYVFISGGRSPKGEIIITFPETKVDTVPTDDQYRDLLKCLVNAALVEEDRTAFSIVVDRRNSKWNIVTDLLHCIFEIYPGSELIENVYLLQPSSFFQSLKNLIFQQSSLCHHPKLHILNSPTDLFKHIDPRQLTADFKGELYYNNGEWIKHGQLIELLSQSSSQLKEDLNAASKRMVSGNASESSAGQIEGEIENLEKEQQQFQQRVDKSLAEAGAEIAQLKTRNGDTLSSSDIPPSSAHHVTIVERLIVGINASFTKYCSDFEKHKLFLGRCLRTRQFEEENNRWCAILDEHMFFLENFNPVRDTAEEIKNCLLELEKFMISTKDEFFKAEEFYKSWQSFRVENLDGSSSLFAHNDLDVSEEDEDFVNGNGKIRVHDNRIELSSVHYNELLALYHDQLRCGLELHSQIEKAANWHTRGTEFLAKAIPASNAEKSVFVEEFDDIEIFMSSYPLQNLTHVKYNDVMTTGIKAVVDDLIVSLQRTLSSCDERRQQLQQLIVNCENAERESLASLERERESLASLELESPSVTSESSVSLDVVVTDADTPNKSRSSSYIDETNDTPNRTSSALNSDSSTLINSIGKLYLSTKSDREFSNLKPVMQTGTIRRKRGHVIQELIATECIYTSELLSIIEGYLRQLDNPELASLIPLDLRQKHHILFGNIEDIYKFHSETFLKCLEICEPTQVGKCFTDYKANFEMYGTYCQNKMQAENLIEEMGSYPFFKECQKRLGHRLPLSSYILKPIQRITKYHLLLRELIKMATSQQEKDDLSEAVESMRDVVKYVNNILHQVSITGFDGNLADQGRLLMQGSVDVWVGRRRDKKADIRSKGHRRHAFLYEKCIIFCKRKEDQQPNERETYLYKNCLNTTDIGLTEAPKGGDERRFEIWCQGRTDVWTILAPNEETKDEWIKEIKRVLFNQYVNQREASRKSVIQRQGTSDSAQPKFISLADT